MAKRKSKRQELRKSPLDFRRLKTPLDHLNIVLAGGFRAGTFTEFFGKTKSGKSAMAYQTASLFLKTFEDGIVHILDTERASDVIRLKHAFDIDVSDTERFDISVTPTLEASFMRLAQITDEYRQDERARLIIWDTISVCPTENEYNSDEQFTGGRQEKPRVIKHFMAKVLSKLEGEIYVIIINQVMDDQSSYVGGVKSGGGHALHHNLHYSLLFNSAGNVEDETGDTLIANKVVSIHKSRFCPEVKKIPFVVSVQDGGVIDSKASLIESGISRKIIVQPVKGYWAVAGEEDERFRRKELAKKPEIRKGIRRVLKEAYCEKYHLLAMEYEEQRERENSR